MRSVRGITMRLNHINIRGPRDLLKKEQEFFCSILGLEVGYRPDFSNNGYWLYSGNQPIVHLTESELHFKNDKQGYFDHVALQSTKITKLIERLKKKEIDHSNVYIEETKVSQVFFKSPSGVGIEVGFENEKIESDL
jgi:catechol 2,3-dioxygenase-like lactoylglutathione lyase family enzyme